MSLVHIIKGLKENSLKIPVSVGKFLAHIPYTLRPFFGTSYRKTIWDIDDYACMSEEQRRVYVYKKMYAIVEYAINNIEFYKEHYQKKGFSLSQLKSFEDIEKIPIISKDDLLNYSLEKRSNTSLNGFLVNTGGSSGKTLSFFAQPCQIGVEWAHIHRMWAKFGFKYWHLRACFVGRSKVDNGVDYEFARHCLSIDIYKPFAEISNILKEKLRKSPCHYLHGYPSVLSDFASYCETDSELLHLLRKQVKAVFLNSEYPYPIYREKIEKVFQAPTHSFYGHTERCVLASEKDEPFTFCPFQTYGYTEVLQSGDNQFDLIGTSYYNYASPLIRYNTQDLVSDPTYSGKILETFKIKEGRSGQTILDANGKKISLTGLIMGRHHKIFDYINHIQVEQKVQGKATIYYVLNSCKLEDDVSQLFDSSNILIDFNFVELSSPIRTVAGKINLLVKSNKV